MKSDGLASSQTAAPPLSRYAVQQLGAERSALAAALRDLLWQRGLRWPAWIDARPGRLQLLVADCVDAPLAATRRTLLLRQHDRLSQGLVAMGLALAAPRLAWWLPEGLDLPRDQAGRAASPIAVLHAPAGYPSQPQRALGPEQGRAWAVPAEQLVVAAELLSDAPSDGAASLISVVGAVLRPAVQSLPTAPVTPRQLVEACGGSTTAAWVPLLADPVHGTIWEADRPLPTGSVGLRPAVLYVLPARHELIRRHRASPGLRTRAANTCLSCTLCTDLCPSAGAGTRPHLLMRALGQGSGQALMPSVLAATAGCTRCGACSVACPAELLPGAVVAAFAAELPSPESAAQIDEEPPPLPDLSRLPWSRMLARLGLDRFPPLAPAER
jgi:ferredoxin